MATTYHVPESWLLACAQAMYERVSGPGSWTAASRDVQREYVAAARAGLEAVLRRVPSPASDRAVLSQRRSA